MRDARPVPAAGASRRTSAAAAGTDCRKRTHDWVGFGWSSAWHSWTLLPGGFDSPGRARK